MISSILLKAQKESAFPFVFLDVGARDADPGAWSDLGNKLTYIGFEPNPKECTRLNQRASISARFLSEIYYPVALAGTSGDTLFNVTSDPACSSLLRPDLKTATMLKLEEHFNVLEETRISTTTLDEWGAEHRELKVDFAKFDVQGAEFQILSGAKRMLSNCIAVQTEVLFVHLYDNQSSFGEIESLLKENGFHLVDLHKRHGRSGDIPASGKDRGILVWGDALFLRDIESWIVKDLDQDDNLRKLIHFLIICDVHNIISYGAWQVRRVLELFPQSLKEDDRICVSNLLQHWLEACVERSPLRTRMRRLMASVLASRLGGWILRAMWRLLELHASTSYRVDGRRIWPEDYVKRSI